MFLWVLFYFSDIYIKKIGVSEYLNIEIPTISVSITHTRASTSIIETEITEQVENSFAGIEGLDNIKSTSKDGLSNVKLKFSIDRNLDNAAKDVRYRISRIYNRLPYDADLLVILQWQEWKLPTIWSVIEGVVSVDIVGNQEKSMRILLNREQLTAHNITVADVEEFL